MTDPVIKIAKARAKEDLAALDAAAENFPFPPGEEHKEKGAKFRQNMREATEEGLRRSKLRREIKKL